MGSVSIQAWSLACAAVILLVGDAIGAGVALVVSSRGGKVEEKGFAGVGGEKVVEEKKEL